jgi:hypothetical protein
MTRKVTDATLDDMHQRVRGAVHKVPGKVWLGVHKAGSWLPLIEGHDLSCLLDELRMRRNSKSRMGKGRWKMSPVTKKLIHMEVWDVIEVGPMTNGALTTCRQTARKHLDQPDAVWHSKVLKGGVRRIERVPNGSPIHADWTNPAVRQLADLDVGEKATIKSLRGKMYHGIKVQARLLMNDPAANWWCENLANGDVRVTRKQ